MQARLVETGAKKFTWVAGLLWTAETGYTLQLTLLRFPVRPSLHQLTTLYIAHCFSFLLTQISLSLLSSSGQCTNARFMHSLPILLSRLPRFSGEPSWHEEVIKGRTPTNQGVEQMQSKVLFKKLSRVFGRFEVDHHRIRKGWRIGCRIGRK